MDFPEVFVCFLFLSIGIIWGGAQWALGEHPLLPEAGQEGQGEALGVLD